MDEGRVDQVHSGPPDTVLPWLEQQQQQQPRTEDIGGSGGEEEEEGERSEAREGEDEKPLDVTLDVCGVGAGRGPGSEDSGGGSKEHALVQEEEKEVGVVDLSVYLTYWAAVGSLLAPAIFTALFLMQGIRYTL